MKSYNFITQNKEIYFFISEHMFKSFGFRVIYYFVFLMKSAGPNAYFLMTFLPKNYGDRRQGHGTLHKL